MFYNITYYIHDDSNNNNNNIMNVLQSKTTYFHVLLRDLNKNNSSNGK